MNLVVRSFFGLIVWFIVFAGTIHVWAIFRFMRFEGVESVITLSATILSINAAICVMPKAQWKFALIVLSCICPGYLVAEWLAFDGIASELNLSAGLMFLGCLGGVVVAVRQVQWRMTGP